MAWSPPKGDGNKPQEKLQTIDIIELYRKLSQTTDMDALHSVIAAHGAGVLDKGLPYVLIATRNRRITDYRRRSAHPEVSLTDVPEPVSQWDPFQELSQSESLRRLASALAELADEEVVVLWRHAEGYTDREIQQEWDARGLEPRMPTIRYIRKRRQRARAQLKKLLGIL